MDLKIGFSTSMPLIKCDGIVIRVKKHPHTFIFGVATAFTEIDEHEKEMIKKTSEENYIIEKLDFSNMLTALSLAS